MKHNIYMIGFSPTSWVWDTLDVFKIDVNTRNARSKTVYAFGPFRLVVCRNVGEWPC